jgi:hypothetical protein
MMTRSDFNLSRRKYRGIWLPYDFYLSLSVSRARILAVPSVSYGPVSPESLPAKGYVRIEAWALLHLCIIVDFRKLPL